MHKKITVAAIQMVSTPDPSENIRAAAVRIGEAAQAGASVVLLPEYWPLLGHTESDKLAHAEQAGDGPLQQFMSSIAKQYGLWLIGGTIPLVSSEPGKVLNTLLAFDPDGKLAARYDKIHLFGFTRGQESYDESRTIVAGHDVAVLETPQLRIGLSVCYDLRFPELYRALHADLLLVPSAFTHTTGQAHWEPLLRARAIENLAYLCAPAQGGVHENGRRTWGHSLFVDPWGSVMAQRAEGEGVVIADLDVVQLQRCRSELPALGHRVL